MSLLQILECRYCAENFITQEDLKFHEKTHTQKFEFSCDKCSQIFYDMDSLTGHMKRHSEKGNVPADPCGVSRCSHCHQSFNKPWQLVEHISIEHRKPVETFQDVWEKVAFCKKIGCPNKKPKRFLCNFSDSRFTTKYSAETHSKRHFELEKSHKKALH